MFENSKLFSFISLSRHPLQTKIFLAPNKLYIDFVILSYIICSIFVLTKFFKLLFTWQGGKSESALPWWWPAWCQVVQWWRWRWRPSRWWLARPWWQRWCRWWWPLWWPWVEAREAAEEARRPPTRSYTGVTTSSIAAWTPPLPRTLAASTRTLFLNPLFAATSSYP